MEPVSYKRNGRELGNAAKCGEIAGGISWETWQWYVRTQRTSANPPPVHVYVDPTTSQRMYPLKDVRAWQAARPGRGNWGGEGARARPEVKARLAAEGGSASAAAAGEDVSTAETADILADPATMAAIAEARAERPEFGDNPATVPSDPGPSEARLVEEGTPAAVPGPVAQP